eukprot:6479948-Amphidinium_carterae.1
MKQTTNKLETKCSAPAGRCWGICACARCPCGEVKVDSLSSQSQGSCRLDFDTVSPFHQDQLYDEIMTARMYRSVS